MANREGALFSAGGGAVESRDLPSPNRRTGVAPALHEAKMPPPPDKRATTPSTARIQALDNLARRGRIGMAKGGPPKGIGSTAHLGRNLQAHDADGDRDNGRGGPNDNDADDGQYTTADGWSGSPYG